MHTARVPVPLGEMRSLRTLRALLCALMSALLGASAAAAATSLDAYALSAGGASGAPAGSPPFSCATFGPDLRAALYHGGLSVGLPTDGALCGVATDGRSATATTGTAQAASSVNATFGTPGDSRSFTGTSAGRAAYGSLGVQAAASYSGVSDSGTVSGAQAGARQIESMRFDGGTGNGTYRATFTIDGSLFAYGRTDTEIEFSYAYGSSPTFLTFRVQDSRDVVSLYANGAYQTALPGMPVTGSAAAGYTVAGSTTFSFDIPITFGTALDITYNLWAAALPSSSVGQAGPSTGQASFLSTARLTGIQVFDASGQALSGFSVTSGSGTLYGPGGVVAVPEPGAGWLMAMGLAALLGWVRRQRRGRADAGLRVGRQAQHPPALPAALRCAPMGSVGATEEPFWRGPVRCFYAGDGSEARPCVVGMAGPKRMLWAMSPCAECRRRQ